MDIVMVYLIFCLSSQIKTLFKYPVTVPYQSGVHKTIFTF